MTEPKTLNAEQQAVVDFPTDQPLCVLAAPGTGKTTALIERAARLAAQPGWGPDNILVLAGNRHAANELRDRLAVRIDSSSSGPIARTVASVAFQIVQSRSARAVTLLTGAEHDTVFAELLAGEMTDNSDDYWPTEFSRDLRGLRGFRTELREFILRTEEFGVSPDRLRALADSANQPVWFAIAEFMDRALTPQTAAHPDQYDSAALVAYAARLVADGEGAVNGSELRAVLVDDAQDATESAISLLRSWASRGVHVSVFGDPDIASNGFRGGQADLIGGFAEALASTNTAQLQLRTRYRGPGPVRQEYSRVVAAIGTRRAAGHREPVTPSAPVSVGPHWGRLLAASPYTEARAIADELRSRHLLEGVPWGDLAVITRSSSTAHELEATLARLGVPTSKNVAKQVLRDDIGARWLLDAANCAYQLSSLPSESSDERTQQLLALIAGPLGGLDTIEIRRLRLQLRAEQFELRDAVAHPIQLELLGGDIAARAAAACATISAAVEITQTGSIEDVLWALWSGSVAAPKWARESAGRGRVAEEAHAALDGVVALFAAAKRFVERRGSESGTVFLAEQFDAVVPEDIITGMRAGRTVTVTTPSQVVGRSFNTVVVAGLLDGIWPNVRPRFSLLHADEMVLRLHSPAGEPGPEGTVDHASERAAVRSDEFRLFALAISRATERVIVSAHQGEDNAVSVLFGDANEVSQLQRTPTRLRDLAGLMRRQLVRAVERNSDREPWAAALRVLAEEGVPGASPSDWYGLLPWSTLEPLHDLGHPETTLRVSPSVIDKLEHSPLAWFVDAFAPGPSSDAQATGTIIHSALEELGANPATTVQEFVQFVEPRLAELPQEAGWVRAQQERRVRKMLERLCQYLERSAASGRSFVAAEAPFRLEYGPIVVSGVIDRVERTESGTYYVVDLKTGKGHLSVAEAAVSAQMQCYQLAIHEGQVTGVEPGEPAGAALLYVQTSAVGPTVRTQDPVSETSAAEIRARIAEAAERMVGPSFSDFNEISDRGPTAARRYRIQVIPGVCA